MNYDQAVQLLKKNLIELKNVKKELYSQIVQPKDEVLAKFQPIFSFDRASELTETAFKDFLLFENNRHWTGLHRHWPKMCADMELLREAIKLILDENQKLETRLDEAISLVNGMGKAVVSAILLVAYPEKYGVWNNTSEGGLKELNLWPKFDRGTSFGNRYKQVNRILVGLVEELNIDLWTLDALWYLLKGDKEEESPATEEVVESDQRFGLEKYLHEFLRDNWQSLPLSKEWEIYSEPGDEEAGFLYPCGKWYIDILAKHKKDPRWLVIELKRNQTSDATIGQVLRYIGYIQEEVAEPGETVEGLVISHQSDESIEYALKAIENVKYARYEVGFKLYPQG